MRVVAGLDKLVAQYVTEKTGAQFQEGLYTGFAVVDGNDQFVAGVIISSFRKIDCEVSMAAETPNWARKRVMQIIFEYIFYRLGCVRCTCIVAKLKGSGRTRRFLEGIGFRLEGNLRRAYDGETDALLYGLLRGECRWLKPQGAGELNGEKERSGTAART